MANLKRISLLLPYFAWKIRGKNFSIFCYELRKFTAHVIIKILATPIRGWEEAKSKEFPFMVRIQDEDNENYVCGGAIIAKDWVITAASCIDDEFFEYEDEEFSI